VVRRGPLPVRLAAIVLLGAHTACIAREGDQVRFMIDGAAITL